MCGVAGILDLDLAGRSSAQVLSAMLNALVHRGPDETGSYHSPDFCCGATRLSIVDISGGQQPVFNENRSVIAVCNGEIFNYQELRERLTATGHRFRSRSDVEVLTHLYEEYEGPEFLNCLSGQFAFALYDRNRQRLIAARDPFGICPFFYTRTDGLLVFASEIKAILRHDGIDRIVDLKALDQVLSLPGIVCPRTIVQGVQCLPAGHYLDVHDGTCECREYWDLKFPPAEASCETGPEQSLTRDLADLLSAAVRSRLQGDVPVGLYLSGGLDSSLIAAMLRGLHPNATVRSFSIAVEHEDYSERAHQELVARALKLEHHSFPFPVSEIGDRLRRVVYHCECPIRELHNAGALALSEHTRAAGMKAILCGQGADELFAGYVGYRFDVLREEVGRVEEESELEKEIRATLWGDSEFFYERDQAKFLPVKRRLYSARMRDAIGEKGCLDEPVVRHERIRGVHPINRRSYVDCKVRLGDHLLADHGDRMSLANSVEMRHPFLDRDFVDFTTRLPVDMKLRGYDEKYALKQLARNRLPKQIVEREKFGFAVPGTPELIREKRREIEDLLDPGRIASEGYFDPDEVARLRRRYETPGFHIQVPFEDDLLAPVLTFGILSELFALPAL